MHHGAPWFIKDTKGRYLQHSVIIPKILGNKNKSFIGLTDDELHLLSVSYRITQAEINSISISSHSEVVSLELHKFEGLLSVTPLIFITTPFSFNGSVCTITRLVDTCKLRALTFLCQNSILGKKEKTDSILEFPVSSFATLNPVAILNDSQWETLWLCLMGFSYRKIADLTGRNLKNTVKILNRSLKSLNLHTINNFLYVSKLYGWERYIPEKIQKKSSSEIIVIEKLPFPEHR